MPNKDEQTLTEVKIAPEISAKHPLQNTWELWYYKNASNDFEKNLYKITSVETVEDFWGYKLFYFNSNVYCLYINFFYIILSKRLYNHIESASKLTVNSAYYFFKKGIRPMWEDYTNKNGGRWVINNKKGNNSKATDNYWLEIVSYLSQISN